MSKTDDEQLPSIGARFSLEGRVAIVTGGGTGIGRAIALVFADRGADVALAGRRREPLEKVVAEVEALGRRALAVPTDVTDAEQCSHLAETVLADLGRIDVLVNNAGGGPTGPPLDWETDQWRQIVDANLGSVYQMARAVVPSMIERGSGSIVNISSGASINPFPIGLPYAAAKAGVNNMTNAMAGAWTPHGVRVNALAVGGIRTELLIQDAIDHGRDPNELGAVNALGRLGEPDEIGCAALFFASDASSFCSGQTLYIAGGPKTASQ